MQRFSESTSSIFCHSFSPKSDRFLNILSAVDEWMEKKRLDEEIRKKLKLILDEILANLRAHASFSEERHSCLLMLTRSEDFLTLDIEDPGTPFDPLQQSLPDVSLSLEERNPGGLGIYLIRRLSDETEYRYENECNILTVRLRLKKD